MPSAVMLADLLVGMLRDLRAARAERDSYRELLVTAIALLAEHDRELRSARATAAHLREQIRQAIGTDGAQRQRDEQRRAA